MRTLFSLLLLAAGLCAQTSTFPAAVDTDSSLFVVGDNVQTSLLVAMAAGDTAAVVKSATGFLPNMIVTVCDVKDTTNKCTSFEHMRVTAVAGPVLSVTRGLDGTVAASHAKDKLVSVAIDRAHYNSVKSALLATETALGTDGTGVNFGAITGLGQNVTFRKQRINSFPSNLVWGQPSGPPVILGADHQLDLLGTGFNGLAAPLSSHVRNGLASGVGLLTTCYNGNNGGGCWGANHNIVSNLTGAVSRMWGEEIDLNTQSAPAPIPASVIGISVVQAGMQQASGRHAAFAAELADLTPHNWGKFKAAFESYNGAAIYGLSLGLAEWVEGSGLLAGLPAPTVGNTSAVYWCTNCNVATPCTAGGAGSYARSTGVAWSCFSTQISSQVIGLYGLTGTTNTAGSIAMSGIGDLLLSSGPTAATVIQSGGSTKFGFTGTGDFQLVGRTIGTLGASANASLTWCADCKNVGDGAVAGAGCVGAGTGSIAIRENALWRCF